MASRSTFRLNQFVSVVIIDLVRGALSSCDSGYVIACESAPSSYDEHSYRDHYRGERKTYPNNQDYIRVWLTISFVSPLLGNKINP